MTISLDRKEIQTILPHRDPFLFVDTVTEVEREKRIVGELRVDDRVLFLRTDGSGAHLPPTLLAEAMAQLGAILVLYPEDNRGRPIYFRAIEECKFERPVPKGATVTIEANVRKMRARFGSLSVTAEVDGTLVASGVMSFALGSGPSD